MDRKSQNSSGVVGGGDGGGGEGGVGVGDGWWWCVVVVVAVAPQNFVTFTGKTLNQISSCHILDQNIMNMIQCVVV